MLKKITVRLVAMLFMFTLASTFEGEAANDLKKMKGAEETTAAQTTCSQTTDEELVKAIREKLAAIPDFKKQMRHINVSVKTRVVTLEGWISGKGAVAQAAKIASTTKCVRRVINKLKPNGGGSCGPGQKPCGDTCIDKEAACTISGLGDDVKP